MLRPLLHKILYLLFLRHCHRRCYANDSLFMSDPAHVLTLCGKEPSFVTVVNYEDAFINGGAMYGGKMEQLRIAVRKQKRRSLVGCQIFFKKKKQEGKTCVIFDPLVHPFGSRCHLIPEVD